MFEFIKFDKNEFISNLKTKSDSILDNINKLNVSMDILSYDNFEKYLNKCIDSLINQSIDFNLFEAIFIVNGELDSTPDIIKKYQTANPEVNIILTESEKGVCNARNKGIELASMKYSIFIDDDDFISENYFEELYKFVKPNRIVLGTFYDIDEDTGKVMDSYMTPQLLKNSGIIENPYKTIKDAIVITTNKIIPTINVKNSNFNPELTNGVDIAYYANFYPDNDFEFYVVDKSIGANYYRLWREGSISRQDMSYEFNIDNRLKVIENINKGLKKAKNQEMRSFIESLTGGQVVKINEYLNKYPKEYNNVLKDILEYDYEFFPYKYLNEDLSKLNNDERKLIISYAFSPTNTTTSNVVAKKILSDKKNVDIICASLDDMPKDFTLEKIVLEYIVNKFTVTFVDFDGSVIETQEVEYGLSATSSRGHNSTTPWECARRVVIRSIIGVSYFSLSSKASLVNSFASALSEGSSTGICAVLATLLESCSFWDEYNPGSSAATSTKPPFTPI